MENSLNCSTGEDSDIDVICDFLNSNCTQFNNDGTESEKKTSLTKETNSQGEKKPRTNIDKVNKFCIPAINSPSNATPNCNTNMIPTINVTPHSPATKYHNIFEDTLTQLQNIRESVVQMKNSAVDMGDYLPYCRLLNCSAPSASLPDLRVPDRNGFGSGRAVCSPNIMFLTQQHYSTNPDRRKSWTTNDDLIAADSTNKSVSLSSLESEDQETVRVTDQRRRSSRNSTGGISTHSLNEAELVRDLERITAKRNIAAEIISRIPLQKSISTSSIIAKEDIKVTSRHLTDSEDENQSLLRAHTKVEVYDNVEKRRKRGSLFFRKKKDKIKVKDASSVCDICGANVTLLTLKDHQFECKAKKQITKCPSNRRTINEKNEAGGDFFISADQGVANFNDDAPLIHADYLNDPPIVAQDLGAEPMLGIALKEHDSWSPSVPKEVLKSLTEKQIKRQEHIYEFIMTEKHHCQTLLVMQKVFVESLERHFPALNVNQMFPQLSELTKLHLDFLKKLRLKQQENYVVDSIADILLDFFSLEKAQRLRLAYGEFCANHRTALEEFKFCITSRDQTFAEWYKHCLTNPLLKKKGIPECILFVTQRLTKYPLLIEPLSKSAADDKIELDKLQQSLNLVKALLVNVDACVAEKELKERQIEIYNRIDVKSFAIYKNKPFRKSDLGIESRRRLKFEGLAMLMQGRSKMQMVLVVVLTDCLCFLSENSAHNKYTLFTPEHKAGVVPLQKLLIREKAGTESRGIYIISSNPAFPEMYELKVQQPKDKNLWIQSIRQAVLDCPPADLLEVKDLTAEEKLKIGINKRELIEKMRQKDIEQALLLEEKIFLQLSLLREQKNTAESTNVSAGNFLSTFGTYKDLVNINSDTVELWKRVLNNVQETSQLASSLYTAATGLPVSRSVSSVGEKQSESYASPILPKRAETFAGFDEKRCKSVFPCRDTTNLVAAKTLSPRLQELEEKHEGRCSEVPSAAVSKLQQISESLSSSHTIDECSLKEPNYAALQVSHNLHTLLCIISQQMTTIHNLQLQLALYRESPKPLNTHNDQLEELRNLQDKLQEEKTSWLKQKEQQEQDLEEQRAQLSKLHEQIKSEQDDVKQQREQLYRKMELLSSQGLILSPNTPLAIANPSFNTSSNDDAPDEAGDGFIHKNNTTEIGSTVALPSVDRRKERWRTASTTFKTPPFNLISATNAPKINQKIVKQKIPMKLSSSSSSKIDKSPSFNVNVSGAPQLNSSPSSSTAVQMLPLKLADKRPTYSQSIIPQHSRTGSSPAIVQHPVTTSTSSPASVSLTRTNSASTSTFTNTPNSKSQELTRPKNSSPLTFTTNSITPSRFSQEKPEEEEIYF